VGVKLGDLVKPRKLAIDDLAGRAVAFDGNNILYQFLSIIRGGSGEPLRDREGRVTSHLSGLIYRNSNLMEAGVRIVYVFDGRPHRFKSTVINQRRETRRKASRQYEKAVKEGDAEKARLYGQQAVLATTDIVEDAKTLLTHMGVPWVQAPGEGEAQTAYMAAKGDVWGGREPRLRLPPVRRTASHQEPLHNGPPEASPEKRLHKDRAGATGAGQDNEGPWDI